MAAGGYEIIGATADLQQPCWMVLTVLSACIPRVGSSPDSFLCCCYGLSSSLEAPHDERKSFNNAEDLVHCGTPVLMIAADSRQRTLLEVRCSLLHQVREAGFSRVQ